MTGVDGTSLSELSLYVMTKDIKVTVGDMTSRKKLRNGVLLVEAEKTHQVKCLLQMTKIGDLAVKVEPFHTQHQ